MDIVSYLHLPRLGNNCKILPQYRRWNDRRVAPGGSRHLRAKSCGTLLQLSANMGGNQIDCNLIIMTGNDLQRKRGAYQVKVLAILSYERTMSA